MSTPPPDSMLARRLQDAATEELDATLRRFLAFRGGEHPAELQALDALGQQHARPHADEGDDDVGALASSLGLRVGMRQ